MADLTGKMRRTSISVPVYEETKRYRLHNKATGDIHECAELAPLLRIIATYGATSDLFDLALTKENW